MFVVPGQSFNCSLQTSKFVKIHGSKLLRLSLRAGSKTIFVVAIF